MPTDAVSPKALMTLAQWFSPSYPLGSFAYSHGLEWAVEAGDVTGVEALEGWLRAVLEHGSGHNDAVFIACAYRVGAVKELAGLDALCRAMVPSKERLLETVQQGSAFAKTTAAIWQGELPEMALPVVVGWAARQQGLPLVATAQFYLHAFASNLVLAGVRLIPIGQTEGQRCLSNLHVVCQEIAADTASATLDDLGSSAFMADIASMKHETQYSRLFRS
ncbi:MAG: urease accessory protein UreF [Paracoccaceae bacterium]